MAPNHPARILTRLSRYEAGTLFSQCLNGRREVWVHHYKKVGNRVDPSWCYPFCNWCNFPHHNLLLVSFWLFELLWGWSRKTGYKIALSVHHLQFKIRLHPAISRVRIDLVSGYHGAWPIGQYDLESVSKWPRSGSTWHRIRVVKSRDQLPRVSLTQRWVRPTGARTQFRPGSFETAPTIVAYVLGLPLLALS